MNKILLYHNLYGHNRGHLYHNHDNLYHNLYHNRGHRDPNRHDQDRLANQFLQFNSKQFLGIYRIYHIFCIFFYIPFLQLHHIYIILQAFFIMLLILLCNFL